MSRYIDADALYMELVKMKDFGELTAKKAIRVVEKAPTIDAVQVIRCKACKWWREDSDHTCKHFYTSPRVANDFCSYAEPKDTTEEVRKQLKDMEQRREMDRKK